MEFTSRWLSPPSQRKSARKPLRRLALEGRSRPSASGCRTGEELGGERIAELAQPRREVARLVDLAARSARALAQSDRDARVHQVGVAARAPHLGGGMRRHRGRSVVGVVAEEPAALPLGCEAATAQPPRASDHRRGGSRPAMPRRPASARAPSSQALPAAAPNGAAAPPAPSARPKRTPPAAGSMRTTAGTRAAVQRDHHHHRQRRRRIVTARRRAPPAMRQARHSANSSSASTASPAAGRAPPRTAAAGCGWSKKATGGGREGISDQAKLNSPKPTPATDARRSASACWPRCRSASLDGRTSATALRRRTPRILQMRDGGEQLVPAIR